MVYTIIVSGRPASHNDARQKKNPWKQKVRAAAAMVIQNPLADVDLRVTVTVFYDLKKRGKMDADNASKPICDALQGVAYANDNQVSARHARKRDISGTYHVKGADPVILNAIQQGDEFVCIKIDNEGGDAHIL